MFVLDFTKPYMYANTIAFYQGNLSTNNTLRCKLKTGSIEDLTGYACTATFYVNGVEVVNTCKVVDRASCIVDIILPTNALVAGEHKMEVILTKPNVNTIQSPMLKYEVWQGLTTGEGVQGTAEYPILVELLNSTQLAIEKTKELQTDVQASLVLANEEINQIPIKVQQKVDEITGDIKPVIADIAHNEEIRQANEAMRIQDEDIRKANEKARIDADLVREHNDADHEKAEAIRATSEEARNVDEVKRAEAEKARVNAENTRILDEEKRIKAEFDRVANYSYMTEDEARRRHEEDIRIANELTRISDESDRKAEENKRRTVETARVKAEELRATDELTRKADELNRKAQETQRVDAETTRQTKYDKLVQDTNIAVTEFDTYTNQAKLDETTRKRNETNRLNAERDRREQEATRQADESIRANQESIRVARDAKREEIFNNKVSAMDAKIAEGASSIADITQTKNTIILDTKNAIDKMNDDFNSLSASQQQDAEVILARDGEESLNARLERDLYIGDKSLKQEVIDLGGLKESQDMAYSTDKGYLVCKETKNGTVKDLKISGKSFKNLIASVEDINGGIYSLTPIYDLLQGEYTLIVKLDLINYSSNVYAEVIFNDGTENANYVVSRTCVNGTNVFNVNFDKGVRLLRLKIANNDYNAGSRMVVLNSVLLEGDHTQSPPNGYFEGIASVGNGVDKIEVSSMNSKINSDEFANEYYVPSVDAWRVGSTANLGHKILERIRGNLNIKVVSENIKGIRVHWFDENKRFINSTVEDGDVSNIEVMSPSNAKYVSYHCLCDDYEIAKCNMYVNSIVPSKLEDEKTILFKDTDGNWKPISELRGLAEVCDTIELHSDGKYYYHIRTEKDTFTHVGSWVYESGYNSSDCCVFTLNMSIEGVASAKESLCDKFNYTPFASLKDKNFEFHVISKNKLFIKINKVKLETQNVEGFKKWLQSNPLTIVYQLAEEKVFEVNPLFLEAYEGETIVSVSSGVVNAPIELKISSYITNLVLLNQQRISILENQVIGMFKSVLNGDMRTLAEALYPQDFVLSDDEIMLLNIRKRKERG